MVADIPSNETMEMEEGEQQLGDHQLCRSRSDTEDNTTAATNSRTSSMTRMKVEDEQLEYNNDDKDKIGPVMSDSVSGAFPHPTDFAQTDFAAADFGPADSSSINMQEIFDNIINRSSDDDQSLNAAVIATLTLCIDQTAAVAPQDARATIKTDVARSKLPRKIKKLKSLFPYKELETQNIAYRGFPVDGPQTLYKSKGWKVQITGASLGAPPEPLPQFPQQEVLAISVNQTYCSGERLKLTAEQVAWNSGQMYLGLNGKAPHVPTHVPTSRSFYTSGYEPGSAVEIMKPFAESIYDKVINGSPFDVQLSLCSNKICDS